MTKRLFVVSHKDELNMQSTKRCYRAISLMLIYVTVAMVFRLLADEKAETNKNVAKNATSISLSHQFSTSSRGLADPPTQLQLSCDDSIWHDF